MDRIAISCGATTTGAYMSVIWESTKKEATMSNEKRFTSETQRINDIPKEVCTDTLLAALLDDGMVERTCELCGHVWLTRGASVYCPGCVEFDPFFLRVHLREDETLARAMAEDALRALTAQPLSIPPPSFRSPRDLIGLRRVEDRGISMQRKLQQTPEGRRALEALEAWERRWAQVVCYALHNRPVTPCSCGDCAGVRELLHATGFHS